MARGVLGGGLVAVTRAEGEPPNVQGQRGNHRILTQELRRNSIHELDVLETVFDTNYPPLIHVPQFLQVHFAALNLELGS